MWKDLTLKQKAEIMKMSVAGGVTDIDSIRKLYNDSIIDNSNEENVGMGGSSATLNNPIRPTEHRFDKGGQTTKKPQPTYQYGLIEQALIEGGAGGYFKVTSAQRKANAAGHVGNSSAHTYTLADGSPAALDIVPNGISWDEFFTIMSTPQMQASLSKYGFDVLNETSAQMMRSTGATGPHLHVGKGIKDQSGTGQIYGGGSYGGYKPWSAAGSNDSALELMSQRRRMRPTELKSTQQDFLLDYLQSASQAQFKMETPKSVEKPTNNTIPKKETSVFIPTNFGLTPKDNNQVTTDPTTAKRNIEYGLDLENNALWNSPYLLFNNSNDYLV